ncbi:MAG TPA: FecR domain-containing protein [Chitinophaga sp.]|uniref:FecR family protein n=1 Tax=Chitinophaga sp. TaxID=1869181 RepID=UPI002CBEE8EA|nr:FecR domain-containing protein [Chitinophaga sp.]HVI44418.1 FecR domain-containing protein [Chitinophaga sp.]
MSIDKQLLEKYFKGRCTDAEQELVEAYLSRPETEELDSYLMDSWQEVTTTIDAVPEQTPQKKQRVITMKHWYSAAAAVISIVGLATWFWQTQKNGTSQVAMIKSDTLYNAGNKVQLFTMPDGSEVWLNAHAAVIYNYSYNQQNRELWLNGEGYFKVMKDETKPFLVHTGLLTTTVLGTEFNIATGNRADGGIEVSLVSGKVAVSVESDIHPFRQILTPGQMLAYRKGQLPVVQQFNKTTILDWKAGKIVFDRTTLEDVFAKLQSRWGCTILLEDASLARKRVTGEFRSDLSLDQILSTLEYVHNFTCTRTGDKAYLVKKKNVH